MTTALEATSKLAAAIARCAAGEVRKVEVLVMMFSLVCRESLIEAVRAKRTIARSEGHFSRNCGFPSVLLLSSSTTSVAVDPGLYGDLNAIYGPARHPQEIAA